jgi:hypothetical protein
MKLFGAMLPAALVLAGCGYPGEPLPPALNRPVRATDVAAVQRGSRIVVQFTVPEETTENLPLRGAPDIELRVGPLPEGDFSFAKWETASQRIPAAEIHTEEIVPAAPATETAKKKASRKKGRNVRMKPARLHATAEVDATKFYGQSVVIGVRVHGSRGQDIGWSRLESLKLVPALPVPEALAAADAPDAVRLDWHAGAPEYRIYRRPAGDAEFRQIGTSDKPFYIDSTIDYGKTYEYQVQSIEKTGEQYAESERSSVVSLKPADRFPPAVPAGLTAVPGARTIELVWERNTERDLASYQVMRDGKKIAEGLTAPAYSDRDVKAGVRYRYQIAALDTAGNLSAFSGPVEAAIP